MDRMQKLGELLHNAREEKEISLKEASSATKIRESMLEALESGLYDAFSSDTHLKSFIKAYSKYLGINEDKAMAMYRRERQISFNQEDEIREKTSKNYSFSGLVSFLFNMRTLFGIIFTLVLVVTLYFFYSQWLAFTQPPTLIILSPDQNQTVQEADFTIEGFTDGPDVKVFVDGNDAFIDDKGKFKVNAKFSVPGSKRFTIVAENEFKRRTEFNLDLIYKAPEVRATTQKIKIANNGLNLQTVNYSKDTKTTFDPMPIKSKEFIEIEFEEKINIKNYDPKIMSFYLNDDINPMKSIDSKEFSVIIENSRPVVIIKQ